MKVQPLIGRLPLLPGESLLSLIARLAKFNNYEPRSILSSLILESGEFKVRGRLGSPSRISQFRYLEALTNVVAYDLYKATAHTFTGILTPPEDEVEYLELDHDLTIPLLSKGVVAKQIRSEVACQFCPLCLKSAASHRLIWLPIACTACLEHKCLLVNTCHKCKARIRIQDVVEATCPNCKTDLTEVEAVSVENDCFGLFTQSVIQSWLLEGVSPTSTVYSLAQQMPRCLYRVTDGLRFSIMDINQDWPLMHHASIQQYPSGLLTAYPQTLTAYQSYCLYATAFKGIIDWPNGFHLFLTAYQKREKKSDYSDGDELHGLKNELGNLYVQWINEHWKQPALQFVQEAFDQYLVDNQISFASVVRLTRYKDTQELRHRLPYMSVNEAAKLLGTSNDRLSLMIKSGRLTAYNEKGRSSVLLLKREDVLRLRDKWHQALTLKEVVDWLGLSERVVSQLVQIGLLAAQQSPSEGFNWMFSPADVIECLERITGRAHNYSIMEKSDKENMLTLGKVCRLFRMKLGFGTTALALQQVALGRLPAYIGVNSKLQLGTLLFASTDIAAYIETVKTEKGWIGPNEVASILGIFYESVTDWVRAGWISPVVRVGAKTLYFDRQAIVNLKSNLVLSAEASTILGITKRDVQTLVRQGRLKPLREPNVDGSMRFYFFRRDSLVEWKDTRATLKEASHLLHMSEQKIVIWIKQGRMPPPEDEKQRPWFFSLQALRRYKESVQERSTDISCTDQAL